ncbi:uncharacterized protein J4E92_009072 [Alternaria infectoria]|uniref:uncharacterized protein n=1 Tax=Alternaria infectoria TaxID=45303 RepID=UPI00221FB763|nr:uncharacterized protein J4E92_009072 [Alternaria infectoria]KAI4916568.1 hypothetical protein J4E92_009072 [Alternaria infectoria]
MTDNLDTSSAPPVEWNADQRSWIQLYYKLLLETIRRYPTFPVCTSDSVAAIAHRMFYRSPEEKQNGINPHSSEDDEIYKASFISYRNAAMPNLLSQIVQLCKDTAELDSRCSIPQVFINRPMLDEYKRISRKYGFENNDPQPWDTQPDLWEFISKAVTEKVLHRGVLDSQDTVVQSFVEAPDGRPPPISDEERAELRLLQQLIQRRLARADDDDPSMA